MSNLEATIHHLPEPILNKLRAMITRVRRLLFVRGLFATLAVALSCLLVIMVIDMTVTLFSEPIRWALSLLGLAATLWTAWWYLIRPLSRKFTLTHIARILEIRHPELQERISTAVELMSSEDPESIRGSEELIAAVVDSAVIDVEAVDPKVEFGAAKVSRFVKIAAVAILLLAVLFLIWPNQAGTLLMRAVAPFLNVGNAWADTLTVTPGDARVPIGDPVTIEMTVQHEKLRRAEIRRRLADGSESVERMNLEETRADGVKKFSVTFPSVMEDFEYRVRAGSALSEFYRIEAVPRPEVKTLTLRYDYPGYTGRAPEEFLSDTGEIATLAHSRVTVRAGLNKAAAKGSLHINREPIATEGRIDGNTVAWDFELLPGTEGLWRMHLEDENGFKNVPSDHNIRAIPDQAPQVAIHSPAGPEMRVRPSELVPFRYEITEDYGFGEVELLVAPNGAAEPLVFRQPLPEPDGEGGTWRGVAPLNLASLKLEPHHHTLTVQLVARDNLPAEYHGPNQGASRKITLILDREAKSLAEQTMDAQREEIREAIKKAQEELNQARNEAKLAERQLAKEEAVSNQTMESLDEFRERANDAQEVLREVGEKMEETVFHEEAEKMQKVADQEVAKAREAADQIPVIDEKEKRAEQAREANRQVVEAMEELKAIEKSLQRESPEQQMVAELNQLANEQRDLAARAAEQAQANQPPPPEMQAQQMAEFQQRQEQVQKDLGKMLAENPEALKDILKQQQDQASELAEQVQKMAEQQEGLKEMTREAAQAESEEALQQDLLEQLQQAQQQIAEETRQLEEQLNRQRPDAGKPLEQASQQTHEAAEALQQQSTEQAKTEAMEASEALADASQQAEKLAEEAAVEEAAAEQPSTAGEKPANPADMAQAQAEPAAAGEEGTEKSAPEASPQGQKTPAEPALAESKSPAEGREAPPSSAEPAKPAQSGEPMAESGSEKDAAEQQAEPSGKGEPQTAEAAAKENSMAGSQSEPAGEEATAAPESGTPMASEKVREQLAGLAERQRELAEQLGAVEARQLDEALAMMEEDLSAQSEELQDQTEALEEAAGAAQQWEAKQEADSAENNLEAAATQTRQAQEKLENAQAAQDAAEQSGQAEAGEMAPPAQQAMKESGGPQTQAHQSLSKAAKALEKTAAALGKSIEGLENPEQPQMLDSEDLAESFEDVSESAQSQDAQQAAQRSQQAAQSLQQLAQSAMEQMGAMAQQQPPQPQVVDDGNPQLNETGMKTADLNGDRVPPELEALGISAADWARLKGNLRAGSASQGADDLPAEYRDLVGRYFQVIAKEAGKNK